MMMYRRSLRALIGSYFCLVAFLMTAPVIAHDSPEFLEDRQPPYQPSGFNGAVGSGPSISFPSNGVHLLSWLPLANLDPGSTSANDSWGYVSPSGREYAIIGLSGGTAFVEVTVPSDPQIVDVILGVNSLWRDIKTFQSFAYVVSEGGDGIRVFDLSQIDSGVVTLVRTVISGGITATHNVAINEASGFLYRVGGGSGVIGLRIYDLTDPSNPAFVGEWSNRYVHDAQIVTFTAGPFAGKEIAFAFSETGSGGGTPGIDILDVSNKANITPISFFQYSSAVFSHQGWLSPDRQFIYANDELDEITFGTPTTTRIIDISDLNNPFEAGTFTNNSPAIDHNLYTLGNIIFESNYRSGLRIYDATNPTAPIEIGFFDTYPEDDNPDFNGLWNNYPFLPSGIVIGSDLEKGLFVWGLGNPSLTFSHPNGLPSLIAADNQTIRVQIDVLAGSSLDPATTKLHLDTGAGFVTTDLISLGGNQYDAVFPSMLTCGANVSYFFSGQTTDGITWRDPSTAPISSFNGLIATNLVITFQDDLETNLGWTVGDPSDTAATGIWTRVDPVGTAAQPENDHTPDPATICFVTGQGLPGGGVGDNDVDGGKTTLTSPTFAATGGTILIRYWRWFSNDQGGAPNEDSFVIDISNDGGANWSNVETVGPSGPETSGGWFFHQFIVSDVIVPTSTMKMRFIAADLLNGSIVEAGIDDFDVSMLECLAPCPVANGDLNMDTMANGEDIAFFIDAILGAPTLAEICGGDFNANGLLDSGDVAGFVTALLGF